MRTVNSPATLLLMAAFITSGGCLTCYTCNSNDPDECHEVKECPLADTMYMERIVASYFPTSTVNYSDPRNLPQPACYTSVTLVDDAPRSRRECSALGVKLTCEVLQKDIEVAKAELTDCTACDKDFCNSAVRHGAYMSMACLVLVWRTAL